MISRRPDKPPDPRAAVFAHYGKRCACCGATEPLCIDHVNGDGRAHRAELAALGIGIGRPFYAWLVEQGFPEGFQTLCRPCNTSKGDGDRCRRHPDGLALGRRPTHRNNRARARRADRRAAALAEDSR